MQVSKVEHAMQRLEELLLRSRSVQVTPHSAPACIRMHPHASAVAPAAHTTPCFLPARALLLQRMRLPHALPAQFDHTGASVRSR